MLDISVLLLAASCGGPFFRRYRRRPMMTDRVFCLLWEPPPVTVITKDLETRALVLDTEFRSRDVGSEDKNP